MIKLLMTGLAVVAFLLAGLSVETWRHAKAHNDPIRERWYAALIMFVAVLFVVMFMVIGSGVARARELRAPRPPQPIAISPCLDGEDSDACREHFKAVWQAYVHSLSKYPTTWKVERPRPWNPNMRPGCGRPNQCGWRRFYRAVHIVSRLRTWRR